MSSEMPAHWERDTRRIREAVLRAADPSHALGESWAETVGRGERVRLLAVGKAAVPMARTAMDLLHGAGVRPADCLVVTTPHPDAGALSSRPGVAVLVADHPLATERNVDAARRVAAYVSIAAPGETLVLLLSGGGSALLTWPADPLTLDDLRAATHALLRAGAPIGELNCVRKHAERLKGGRLARLVPEGVPIIALVVSDVLGDPLDVISSGPVSPDPTTYMDALRMLERRGLRAALPRLVDYLARGARGEFDETPKPGNPALARVTARVIAGNQQAALAARDAALALGAGRVKVVFRVEGEASQVGRALVRDAVEFAAEPCARTPSTGPASPTPLAAVIYAGETTVTVGASPGLGGRNQELALAAAMEMDLHSGPNTPRLVVMTLATDGIDGPTDAAGAVVTGNTAGAARDRAIDLAAALANHDSYHVLDALACLIRTGPTGTNVNDVAIALVYAPLAGGRS